MAKVKSVKFYNFVELSGSNCVTVNAQFYDINGKLILIDFSNPISSTNTYSENSEYIITSYSSYSGSNYYPYQSFHTGNKNLNVNLPQLGRSWVPVNDHATVNDFLKIEFKFPQYISKIEILHAYSSIQAIDTLDYDIEFNDRTIKTYHFKSNGKFSPISNSTMTNFSWDQNVMDSLFTELKFDKSKPIYDTKIGYSETFDTNNFRNIPVDKFEKLKVLHTKPLNTYVNCLISFDKKQTWKTFNGTTWTTVSDTTPSNIILNCMDIETLNTLTKQDLIQAGFTGDLDFKVAIKTNNEKVTSSISKIYVIYKNPF